MSEFFSVVLALSLVINYSPTAKASNAKLYAPLNSKNQLPLGLSLHPPQPRKPLYLFPSVSKIAYRSYLAEHPEYKTPIKSIIKNQVEKKLSLKLDKLLKRAQSSFLSNSLVAASKNFLNITHLATKAHWQRHQRKTIFYSYIRLAQLANNSDQANNYLRQAIAFASDLPIDRNIFPPPIVHRFNSIKKNVTWLHWTPNPQVKKFDQIIINGRSHNIFEGVKIKLPLTKVRITLLSNRYLPVTKIFTGQKILNWQFSHRPFLSGTCSHPMITEFHRPTARALINEVGFYPNFCLGVASKSLPKKNWQRTSSVSNMPLRSPQEHDLTMLSPIASTSLDANKKNFWYKNKWIFLGLGLITAGILINTQNKSDRTLSTNRSSPPKEGY